MQQECRELKTFFRANEESCAHVITLFQLLSNKARFHIMCLLVRGEFCVNEIVEVVNEGKLSNVSQQLKILSLSGVIKRRKVDRNVLYSLKDERVRKIVQFLQTQYLNGE
jgi:DNA-binding transcriptional ArsR family regulator